MHPRLYSLLLVATFFSLVLAAPTTSKIQKRSFKVTRKRNAAFTGHDGPAQLIKSYQKFGLALPSGLHSSVPVRRSHERANGTGIVTATPVEPNDIEYIAPITVGGQTLDLNFDTGSSDLWLFNTQLPAPASRGHTLFDPSKSPTFQPLPEHTFNVTYGDGSGASGTVGTDTVALGGVSVTSQALGLATAVAASFTRDTASSGLLGLGFSQTNSVRPRRQRTFFANALPSLAQPVFTADLRADAVGAYEFGDVDATRFAGDLAWAPVDSARGFWEFASARFAVGDADQVIGAPGATAIVDTGTTLMLVKPAVVNAYYSQVEGSVNSVAAGGITFPCDAALPDLFVDVGDAYMARVEGKYINFARVDENTCFGGVQSSAGSDFQIFGDIFFKSQFVAFNGGNLSIGLAPHSVD